VVLALKLALEIVGKLVPFDDECDVIRAIDGWILVEDVGLGRHDYGWSNARACYAQKMPELGRPAIVAIGFAVVALLTSAIAVVVVMRRDVAVVRVLDRIVDASEVTKLERTVVSKAGDGVVVNDEALLKLLGLEPTDVMTSINGHPLKRGLDVYNAMLASRDATIVYVEIVRGKRPLLLRWKLEGSLRLDPPPVPNPFTAPRDPLVETIERIDSLHFTVPRASIERFLAQRDYYARQARIVPAVRNGQPLGYRLFAIQTGSVWGAIGLFSGDAIQHVNGEDPANPDRYRDASDLKISVLRRGGTEEIISVAIQ
jgi:type II secretory pathway component PulC